MTTFPGTLHSTTPGETPLMVSLQFDGNRIRMWSDRLRIGSWEASDVRIRRESIFRFLLLIGEDEYRFSPEDPSGFTESVDVEIDLTTTERPRFGLADRLRQAEAG